MDNGIIYQGPSLYDGAPVVVVATMGGARKNAKTGAMLQTYIIRADMDPRDASKTGADAAICGDCIHRGVATDDPGRKTAKGRTCYVALYHGPLQVWKALQRGFYPLANTAAGRKVLGAGRMVRIGTYGDPACVPDFVWDQLLAECEGWTAYTHKPGWNPAVAMQSADTLAQAREFWAQGSRTFRTVNSVDEIDTSREVLCPASKEAGKRTTCEACKLCAGTSTRSPKSVAIPLH